MGFTVACWIRAEKVMSSQCGIDLRKREASSSSVEKSSTISNKSQAHTSELTKEEDRRFVNVVLARSVGDAETVVVVSRRPSSFAATRSAQKEVEKLFNKSK